MYGLIIAGGSGTRLWPLSRSNHPKQLIPLLNSTSSLLQDTFTRLSRTVDPERIFTVTGSPYSRLVLEQLQILAPQLLPANILAEPTGRDSAPAVLWGALRISHLNPDAVLVVVWSDQLIREESEFDRVISHAGDVVRDGGLLAVGVTPTRPETGLGYIKWGAAHSEGVYQVDRFVEKPDAATAERYLSEGGYAWNAGIFVFNVATLLAEFERLAPEMMRTFQLHGNRMDQNDWTDPDLMERIYTYVEKDSIDYLLLERTDQLMVLPCTLGWSDLGTWNVLYQESPKNEDGNVVSGNVVTLDSRNSLVHANQRLVTTIGIEDMIVVDTEDALLICSRERDQDVKLLVDILRQKARPEVDESRITLRPWGSFHVIFGGPGFQLKLLEVHPGHKLSLQMHKRRAEHWVVTEGEIIVTLNEDQVTLGYNDYIHIPLGAKHRIENRGPVTARLVELQLGDYLGEDDIIRLDDDYGRT